MEQIDKTDYRKRILLVLAATLSVTCFVLVLVSNWLLYQAAQTQARNGLDMIAQTQARNIEHLIEDELIDHQLLVEGRVAPTTVQLLLDQIDRIHDQFNGFGETGEFVLGYRTGDRINFYIHRSEPLVEPPNISVQDSLAEPMRLALQGRSGHLVGLDYQGDEVLAAYQPVNVIGRSGTIGVVAKVQLSELRAPFANSAWIALLISVVAVVAAVWLITRLVSPLIRHLELSEQKYRTVVEGQSELICRCDGQGVITFVNEACCRYFGLAAGQLLGMSLDKDWGKQSHRSLSERIARLTPDQPAAAVEHIMPVNGQTGWLRWNYHGIFNRQGELQQVQWVGQDVSDSKQAQLALQEAHNLLESRVRERTLQLKKSEERYRQLFKRTGAIGLLIDANDGLIVDANDMAMQFYGFKPQALGVKRVHDIEVRGQEVVDEMVAAARQGELVQFFSEHYAAGGQLRDVEVFLSTLEISTGRLLYAVVHDRTDQKQTVEALEYTEGQLQALMSHSPDLIMVVDRQSRIEFLNRTGAYQQSMARLIGQPSFDLLPKVHQGRYRRALQQVFEQEKAAEFEWSTEDGSYWHTRLVPIGSDDQLRTAMVTSSEVTENRVLQAQATRSTRLATLGVLSVGVAHEINNPNSAIQFSNLLLSSAWQDALPVLQAHADTDAGFSLAGLPFSEMEQEIPRLSKRVGDNVQRISSIVDNLKRLVRDDGGALNQQVDLVKTVEGSLSVLHNQIQRHTDHLNVELPDSLPLVLGNHQQLEQVMINIIHNALQALPDRTKAVRVSAWHQSPDQLVIEVEDQGRGIRQEHLHRLIDPFFSTRPNDGGTGLGLSICDRIVKQHRGSMEFESEWGEGTRARIYLPMAEPRVEH